jgi:hypothetical protein
MINKDDFSIADEMCYKMAEYDLSILKLKSPKAFANQKQKLTPKIKNPTDEDLIEALFLAYDDKTTRSVNRKFEKLCKEGIIDPLSPIE